MLPDFSPVQVLVVGDIMLDQYIWGDVNRISPEAPVPVVRITRRTTALGGAGNVASNLAGLGAGVGLLGLKGADLHGQTLTGHLRHRSIQDWSLVREDMPTITKTRIMGQNQQLMRLDEEHPPAPGIEDALMERFQEAVRPGSLIILSDYGKGLLTPRLCRWVVQTSREMGLPLLVDPKGRDWSRYRGALCLTPNTRELAQAAGISAPDVPSLIKAGQELCTELEVERILLTRGSQGMILIQHDGDPLSIPTQSKEVFDVSGAGDTVISCLTACLGAGLEWAQATRIANIAAGIVVSKLGTHPIDREELDQVLSHYPMHNPKITTWQSARNRVASWQDQNQKVVFTNGCFDLLHPGHIKLLQEAARHGNRLVVGLNSDASVARLKGPSRPILSEHDRATLLSALECVDLVVIFDQDTPLELITNLRPDILVKGGDYQLDQVVGRDIVESSGGKVVLVDLVHGISTTDVVQNIVKGRRS
jgi:D-beta-D-heptose 7-phosphate kinase/D-beta-D-heptose 1-phosphate adenosyltransferase